MDWKNPITFSKCGTNCKKQPSNTNFSENIWQRNSFYLELYSEMVNASTISEAKD